MPYEVAIDDVFLVAVDGRLNGQQDLLTMHYRVKAIELSDPVPYPQFAADFVSFLDTGGWMNALPDVQSVDFDYVRLIVQIIHPTRQIAQYVVSSHTSGAVVTPAAPQNVAVAVTLRGDLAERSNIATKHIGGIPIDSLQDGMVKPGPYVDFQVLGDSMIEEYIITSSGNEVTMTPIIFHRETPAVNTPITSRVVGRTSRVDRRRTVGVGS